EDGQRGQHGQREQGPRGTQRSEQQPHGGSPANPRQQTEQQSPSTSTTKQGSNDRAMTSKDVSLTTEQRTTIRNTVLTKSAPRVERLNFDIRVGTAVPRTVRVAPVPTTLVEIHPAWRGYMYFVHADEIIVVEPNTLHIVAVL